MYLEKLRNAKVAIAGLGGLGSNIAVMLTRAGVGELFLVDFDRVEESNLNRQVYTRRHIGINKTEALEGILREITDEVIITSKTQRVTDENALELFGDYDIVCEAFDKPEAKAMLVGKLLGESRRDVRVLSGSGMAGYGNVNEIRTTRKMERLYVSGDFVSCIEEVEGLCAPRVMTVAAHQAHTAIRLILGLEEAEEEKR